MALPSLFINEAQVYRYWPSVQGDRDAVSDYTMADTLHH
jgi:hypothetical protein